MKKKIKPAQITDLFKKGKVKDRGRLRKMRSFMGWNKQLLKGKPKSMAKTVTNETMTIDGSNQLISEDTK